ncbi:MAG TPA: hypothetical protein VGI88_03900 [Verrucomicrobiae bacterium]|jgi:hypothetical protein
MTNVTSTAAPVPDSLRDIKPPAEFPNPWLWIAIGVIALALIALAIGLFIYFRTRRKQVPIVPPVPPHIRAKQKLQEALDLIAQPKPFCTLVADTVRFYLEERFTFHAPERTTEEFLHELQNTNRLLPDQKESLGDFLKSCDLVKFARYEPREIELRELHGSAVRLVEETEPAEIKAESESRESGNEKHQELVNRKS